MPFTVKLTWGAVGLILKTYRLVAVLVKDNSYVVLLSIVIVWTVPSAVKVEGDGLPPVIVTVAPVSLGTVTLMGSVTRPIKGVMDSVLDCAVTEKALTLKTKSEEIAILKIVTAIRYGLIFGLIMGLYTLQ